MPAKDMAMPLAAAACRGGSAESRQERWTNGIPTARGSAADAVAAGEGGAAASTAVATGAAGAAGAAKVGLIPPVAGPGAVMAGAVRIALVADVAAVAFAAECAGAPERVGGDVSRATSGATSGDSVGAERSGAGGESVVGRADDSGVPVADGPELSADPTTTDRDRWTAGISTR